MAGLSGGPRGPPRLPKVDNKGPGSPAMGNETGAELLFRPDRVRHRNNGLRSHRVISQPIVGALGKDRRGPKAQEGSGPGGHRLVLDCSRLPPAGVISSGAGVTHQEDEIPPQWTGVWGARRGASGTPSKKSQTPPWGGLRWA